MLILIWIFLGYEPLKTSLPLKRQKTFKFWKANGRGGIFFFFFQFEYSLLDYLMIVPCVTRVFIWMNRILALHLHIFYSIFWNFVCSLSSPMWINFWHRIVHVIAAYGKICATARAVSCFTLLPYVTNLIFNAGKTREWQHKTCKWVFF